ncbi:hypothetical protein B9Q04_04340 [Candidatus Marsarchaeota G2 archaeon BE_D]|jgi:threonine-phosphate decarboxylase|uniref:Aminotransferase class I/classII large domain-containing protein n=1 Tax=Candidatus Marsarchaeota G2 archaeon BE_D TaxID=1978158 RepID=A0A2R6CCR5_9ARCH|nr:MAG: hypothetical protein B9Q04_04340 [Candidatus Marsarchaeota G2 archaeon BE_D]
MLVRRARHGGDVWDKPEGLIDFSTNTNPLGPPPGLLDVLRSNLDMVTRYPDPEHRRLRDALSKANGLRFDEILVGCGSTELIYLAAQAVWKLRGRGFRALIAEPTFGEYEIGVARLGGRPSFVFPSRDDLRFEIGDIIRSIPRSGVVFLCNPNNPTAQSFNSRSVEEVVSESSRLGSIVVVDESFMEFTADPEGNSVLKEVEVYDNLVVLRSPAKLFAVPGLRVGYGAASAQIARLIRSLQQPWSVGVMGEMGLLAALAHPEFVRSSTLYVRRERDMFAKRLGGLQGLRIYPSDANFLLVNTRGVGVSGRSLKGRLLSKGVLIRECSDFRGLDNYHIRVAVRLSGENDYFVKALRGVLGL